MSHTLLIDGNNLVAINTHTHSGLTAGMTFTGGVFGTLRKIRAMLTMSLSEYDINRVVFVEDFGIPAFRKKLCPEYKTGRKSRPTRASRRSRYRRHDE
jgi:5'-3' exonuclease